MKMKIIYVVFRGDDVLFESDSFEACYDYALENRPCRITEKHKLAFFLGRKS